jgi:putative (di)nucleoside polyphosphate hydrolase
MARRNLDLLDSYPEPLAYELPATAWSKKTGRGQVGYWFLLRFDGSDAAITVEGSSESSAWKWMPFARLVDSVVAFRKPIYRHLYERFKPHLGAGGRLRRRRVSVRRRRVRPGTRARSR